MISEGDRTELICLNLLNIRSKICRQSLILCIILNLVGNLTNKTKDTKKNQALLKNWTKAVEVRNTITVH